MPAVFAPVRPRDGNIGDADGIIVGTEEGVCRLLPFGFDEDGAHAPTFDLARVGRDSEKLSTLVVETRVREVSAGVGQSVDVKADADLSVEPSRSLLTEIVQPNWTMPSTPLRSLMASMKPAKAILMLARMCRGRRCLEGVSWEDRPWGKEYPLQAM